MKTKQKVPCFTEYAEQALISQAYSSSPFNLSTTPK